MAQLSPPYRVLMIGLRQQRQQVGDNSAGMGRSLHPADGHMVGLHPVSQRSMMNNGWKMDPDRDFSHLEFLETRSDAMPSTGICQSVGVWWHPGLDRDSDDFDRYG